MDRIVSDVESGRISGSYTHGHLVRRNELGGFELNVDCSGLVVFLLKTTRPSIYKEIRHFIRNVKGVCRRDFKRIFTHDFYELFEKIDGASFRSVGLDTLSDADRVKKGDIVVYLPPGTKTYGHMGVVASDCVSRHSDKVLSVDLLHSPTFGEQVKVSRLFLSHDNGRISGVSFSGPGRLREVVGRIASLKGD